VIEPRKKLTAGALVVDQGGGSIDVPRGGETARQCGLRHRQRRESRTKVVGNSYSLQWLVLMARHEDPAGVVERGKGAKGYPGTWEISSLPTEGFFFSRYCGTKGQPRRGRMSEEKS
jgi:hypothetical protein